MDDFFTRGSDDEEEEDERAERKEKKKAKELEISSARDTKYQDDADVNIDDI